MKPSSNDLDQLRAASAETLAQLEWLLEHRVSNAASSLGGAGYARVLQGLADQRGIQRRIYQDMLAARQQSNSGRDEAVKSRNSRLNRDWFKDHLQSDANGWITWWRLDRNSFDFDTLVSLDETTASQLSPHEVALQRIECEYKARQSLREVLRRRESKLKNVKSDIKLISSSLRKLDQDLVTWIDSAQSLAQKYETRPESALTNEFADKYKLCGDASEENTQSRSELVDEERKIDKDESKGSDTECNDDNDSHDDNANTTHNTDIDLGEVSDKEIIEQSTRTNSTELPADSQSTIENVSYEDIEQTNVQQENNKMEVD